MERCNLCATRKLIIRCMKCGIKSCIKCNGNHNCTCDHFSEQKKKLMRDMPKISSEVVTHI